MEEMNENVTVEEVNTRYDDSDIQVLEGLEAVRKRPGMYIGSTSEAGLHHLVWEIVDNGIDEALGGFATEITVKVDQDNIVTVVDDGRGIPTGIHEKTGISTVETIYTVLHAGGKFGGGAYKVSGGLHGVGASVVNALSDFLEVYVERDGKKYFQRFEHGGKPVAPLKEIGTSNRHGTTVRFKADGTIFKETTVYNHETLRTRLRELAFLNKGIKIVFIDERTDPIVREEFLYDGGIREYVEFLTEGKNKLLPNVLYMEGKDKGITVEIAFTYDDAFNRGSVHSYCNNINTHEGGYHELGFRTGLNAILTKYAKDSNLLKNNEESFKQEDIIVGLTAVVSIKHPDPQYEGQTKTKLGNSEVSGVVRSVMNTNFKRYLDENPKEAKLIIEKILNEARGRLAAEKARMNVIRKTAMDELDPLLGKLADCNSRNPEECEIFIVEGDSAGGSAKMGRQSRFQAILPLRGKILNVEKAVTHRIFDNAEIRTMFTAFGVGHGNEIDISKLRYHKIVIMTDADVDGAHIRILLLTFFYRYLRPLIEGGYVYFAQPPLFKLERGNTVRYAYSDEEMERIKLEMGEGISQQRYKGLGEMNPEQLWETTMDPDARILKRVRLDDAEKADQILTMLMGDEVEPRKDYIMNNAHFAKDLDF